jgi:maleate cis-trans isomerase
MNLPNVTRIGLLSPEGTNSRHFRHFENLLPPEIEVSMEGLHLVRTSRYDLRDKADYVVQCALEFVRKQSLQGLIVTGAPLAILNPGLETKVSQAVGVSVVTAVSSSIAALRAVGAKKLVVMTPFDGAMNENLVGDLKRAELKVLACPAFEDPTVGAGAKIDPEELLLRTVRIFGAASEADAIYFQGARLDPLPIIARLEQKLGIPVIASNPAMLWHLLSRLGRRCARSGYGKLLAEWPVAVSDSRE